MGAHRFSDDHKIIVGDGTATKKLQIESSADIKHNLNIKSVDNPASHEATVSALIIDGGALIKKNLYADALNGKTIESAVGNIIRLTSDVGVVSSLSSSDATIGLARISNIDGSTISCSADTKFISSESRVRSKFFSGVNLQPSKEVLIRENLLNNDLLPESEDIAFVGSNAIDLYEYNNYGTYTSGRESGYFINNDTDTYAKLNLIFDFSSFLYQQPESVAFNSVKIHYGYYSDSDIADFKSKIVPEYSAFRMKDEGNTGTYLYKKCFDIDFDPLSESIAKGNVLFEFNSDNKIL